jgi:hypothetical protein
MSRDGSITLIYGDGEHRFRLPIGQLVELEEKCGAGLPDIFLRLQLGKWKVNEPREILRLGLVGGGMAPADAEMVMRRYFDPPERPKAESIPVAFAVLGVALQGVPDEPLGKDEPAGENATTTDAGLPDGAEFTGPPPQSDSVPSKSGNGHSGNGMQ